MVIGSRSGPTAVAVSPDGKGGAVIVWFDGRSTAHASDIYAQRVSAAGQIRWAADGVPVLGAMYTSPGAPPAILNNQGKGTFVCWTDGRDLSNALNIYAQYVDSTGASRNHNALVDYVAYRDQDTRLSFSAGLTNKETKSYFADQFLAVSSRTLTVLDVHTHLVGGKLALGQDGEHRERSVAQAEHPVAARIVQDLIVRAVRAGGGARSGAAPQTLSLHCHPRNDRLSYS